MKNKKIILSIKAIGSFLLLLAVLASGALTFHTFYYELIYVSGPSMFPTLNQEGEIVDFGILDRHESALKHIQRFDIVSSYYPSDYSPITGILKQDAKKKIKRVIALPSDTFEINNGLLYISNDGQFELIDYPFETSPSDMTNFTEKDTETPITLGDDEYWLLGDNRANSHDCASIGEPVQYENLFGVLVAIEGKAEVYIKEYVCSECAKKYSEDIGTCADCGQSLNPISDLKNKQYHLPRYF